MQKILVTIILLVAVSCHFSSGENILFVHSCASYSHRAAQWPFVKALTQRGHKVTFISPYGTDALFSNPNVTDIQPLPLKKFMDEIINSHFDVNHRSYGLVPPLFAVLDLFCFQACDNIYRSDEIKNWLATNPKIDLVVGDLMPDCSYGFAKKLNAKNMVFQPLPMVTKLFEPFGMTPETSSIPDYDASKKTPLSFFARVGGALLPLWYRMLEMIFYEKYKTLFQEVLGITNFPNVYDIRDLTSLIMINGDYLSDYPRSLPPFVVKVEGIHLKDEKELKPLPKDMEDFINSNNSEGFVYISFGTVARAGNLPMYLQETFMKAVQAFPKVKFVWRWEGEHPKDTPANLFLANWVDQQSLMVHPKLKMFLTQAGRPSSQEALFAGVPTITFPILADQDFNSHRMEELGASIGLDFVGLTEEKLVKAISEILNDPSYKKRAVQLQSLAKDVPMGPMEKAIWWIEFVLRRSQDDLNLMKPLARHLTWYQKRDFDVWLFLGIVISLCSYIFYLVVRRVFGRCFKGAQKTNTKLKAS